MRPTIIQPPEDKPATPPSVVTLDREPTAQASDLQDTLADVMASCPDPLFIVDRRGLVERMNAAALAIISDRAVEADRGLRINAVLRRVCVLNGAPSDHPFDVARVGDLQSLVESEEGVCQRVYDLRVSPRSGSDSDRGGHIVQLIDVTPLLAAMRGREAARRHRDGILSLLSHDLRSPHAAILATVNHPDFSSAPANLRQIIERAARRSLNMVDSLVRSVRAETAAYEFREADLAHVLEEATDSMWARARDNKSSIELEIEDGPYPVSIDRAMVTQAIADTLGNFITFGLPGQPVHCRLSRGVQDGSPTVICEVYGTVRQVSDGELGRIFNRFAASQKGDVGSLGDSEGLQLSRTIMERHGGELTCRQLDGARRMIALKFTMADSRNLERDNRVDKPEAA